MYWIFFVKNYSNLLRVDFKIVMLSETSVQLGVNMVYMQQAIDTSPVAAY